MSGLATDVIEFLFFSTARALIAKSLIIEFLGGPHCYRKRGRTVPLDEMECEPLIRSVIKGPSSRHICP